jgi:catechol 2,3-dioxygenase-like lactoylglutathione lyase family enzyme
MFSHTMLGVSDLERAVAFYTPIAEILGWRQYVHRPEDGWAGWQPGQADDPFNGAVPHPGNGTMLALDARTCAQVDKCHALAMASGGRDEGAPGLRPHYHPDYYGAYFRDLDGNKICVVCHEPPAG